MEPDSHRMIAEAMGETCARLIARRWGGLVLYIPCVCAGQTWETLVGTIGEAPARKFIAAFGGQQIYVATSVAMERRMRRLRAVQMRISGHRVAEIARALNCTTRTVFRMLADPDQPEEMPR